jgi:hypothetical protein
MDGRVALSGKLEMGWFGLVLEPARWLAMF